MDEGERAAIAAHPDLRRLADLRDQGGWRFLHQRDGAGDIQLTAGYRTWPDGTADVLQYTGPSDARAWRTDADDGVVWTHTGELIEVVDGLLELPPPGSAGAPRRRLGGANRLWVP